MGILDKTTYGEYYWAMQVEAQAAFDEQKEDALSPFFAGILGSVPEIEELPASMQHFLNVLREPHSAGLGGFLVSAAGEFAAETLKDLIKPGMAMLNRSINRGSLETWLTSKEAITLSHRKWIDDDFFYLLTASEGYEKIVADFLYHAEEAYPSIPDLMLWARYHGNPLNTREKVWERFDINVRDYDLWEWLSLQRLQTSQVHTLYRRGIIDEGILSGELYKIGWREDDVNRVIETEWSIPNAMLLLQGDLQQGKDNELIIKDISKGDIHPDYAQTYMDAVLTKPSSGDVIAYQLRQDSNLPNVEQELKRIGIHPDHIKVYKELAYPIPPVADIITMAVREAFSPEIAERFGQYEDFPPEFAEWAAKKGITEEWSMRYWASHWSLPSTQQGFEMLHRGIIDQTELNMLLRALDIMPFWRKKLTEMAYRRITRVDVRRLYKAGVLTEIEVYQSYLDLGYNEVNAQRMTDFTIEQAMPKEVAITKTAILKAFETNMLDRYETETMLKDLAVTDETLSFLIKSVEYKKELDLQDNKIKAIKNLYKKREYDNNKALSELLQLDMPDKQASLLLEQWLYEKKAVGERRWTTAQTLDFMKKGLITRERGIKELTAIGYNVEHIAVYMNDTE
ncbi:hypothetical protein LCGC14_1639310 [marine sediment metagenome]|uniref:Uncharacterized protein n=1 Tax=marine sediment metagenome TaxID=412755 RepID=A0A0F9KG06_9ZZZZ